MCVYAIDEVSHHIYGTDPSWIAPPPPTSTSDEIYGEM